VSPHRQLLLFFTIAFAYTWTLGACMIAWRLPIEFSIVVSAGPLIASLVTSRVASGHYRAFRFNVSWPRTVGAVALGVPLVLVSEIVLPAMAIADARRLGWSVFVSLSTYNYSTLLGGPLFEEPGWRGFALPRLESLFSPILSSLILGALWASWHLPFFWYPGWSSIPIWNYFLIVIALSIMLTLATNVARFGIIAPILMHAANNSSGKYFAGLFAKVDPGSGGFLATATGLASRLLGRDLHLSMSFGVLVATGAWTGAIVALVATRGRLGFSGAPAANFLSLATTDPNLPR
jgi:membrane protease YdiL (CAAX protease family)